MSDVSQGPGWWRASDGRWYPPEMHPPKVRPPRTGERNLAQQIRNGVMLLAMLISLSFWSAYACSPDGGAPGGVDCSGAVLEAQQGRPRPGC